MDEFKIKEALQEIEIKNYHLHNVKDGHTHLTPSGADLLYKFIEVGLKDAVDNERERIIKILEQFKNNQGFNQPLKGNDKMNAYWISESTWKEISEG